MEMGMEMVMELMYLIVSNAENLQGLELTNGVRQSLESIIGHIEAFQIDQRCHILRKLHEKVMLKLQMGDGFHLHIWRWNHLQFIVAEVHIRQRFVYFVKVMAMQFGDGIMAGIDRR